ncbi:hypothetical protein GLYMA_18G187750v4 [Glycine max]|nr:hypothetical protein GLYMA_18G187750v4 [Glycine max]KAH1155111.1 hypothetical protein GYH30_050424 [Glycine max]
MRHQNYNMRRHHLEDDHGLGGTGDNLKWPVLHVALHQRVQESATNEALGVENGVLLVQCGCLTTHPRNCRVSSGPKHVTENRNYLNFRIGGASAGFGFGGYCRWVAICP